MVARKNDKIGAEATNQDEQLDGTLSGAGNGEGNGTEDSVAGMPGTADYSSGEAVEERALEMELAKAVAEKEECQDRMLRMAAELDNYKKRMTRERDNALKYAGENLIKDLLPTIDNLGRALNHEPGADLTTFVQGVEMTLQGLLTTLEKAGLTPISSVGEVFDPNLHEAMAMEASSEVPEQHIIKEFEKGYYFKDRLIRAAKVVVSKGM